MTLSMIKKFVGAAVTSMMAVISPKMDMPKNQPISQPVIQHVQPAAVSSTKKIQREEYRYLFAGQVMCGQMACAGTTEMKLVLTTPNNKRIEKSIEIDREGTYLAEVSLKEYSKRNLNWTLTIRNSETKKSMIVEGTDLLEKHNKIGLENLVDMDSRKVESQRIIG